MAKKHKRRVGIGSVAPNPDVKSGVHVSVVANSTTIATEYNIHDVPMDKKPRNMPPTASPSDVPKEDNPQPQRPKRKQVFFPPAPILHNNNLFNYDQGASVMMDTFSAHLDTLQSTILKQQYHEDVGKACRCGATTAPYRCEECFDPLMLCQACIVLAHVHVPFHHIGEWSGTHFNRTSLFALGATLRLGHRGDQCRHCLPEPGRANVIVHTNGIHQVRIE